jgi:hypothetical protein
MGLPCTAFTMECSCGKARDKTEISRKMQKRSKKEQRSALESRYCRGHDGLFEMLSESNEAADGGLSWWERKFSSD